VSLPVRGVFVSQGYTWCAACLKWEERILSHVSPLQQQQLAAQFFSVRSRRLGSGCMARTSLALHVACCDMLNGVLGGTFDDALRLPIIQGCLIDAGVPVLCIGWCVSEEGWLVTLHRLPVVRSPGFSLLPLPHTLSLATLTRAIRVFVCSVFCHRTVRANSTRRVTGV
jgi:hypothetical protein